MQKLTYQSSPLRIEIVSAKPKAGSGHRFATVMGGSLPL